MARNQDIFSNYEIANYLHDFYIIMKQYRQSDCSFYNILEDYYHQKNYHMPIEEYFDNMKAIVNTFNSIELMSITRDLQYIDVEKDSDTEKQASFIPDELTIKKDSEGNPVLKNGNIQKHNKVTLINYIRNALHHSGINQLFSLNKDGTINICLQIKQVNVNFDYNFLHDIYSFITYYAKGFMELKINHDIDYSNLLKDKDSCINELNKIIIKSIRNKNKTNMFFGSLEGNVQNEESFDGYSQFFDPVDDEMIEYSFQLSNEQIKNIANKIFHINDIEYVKLFINDLIFDSIDFPITKIRRLERKFFIEEEILNNPNKKYSEIIDDFFEDLVGLDKANDAGSNFFLKNHLRNYGNKNIIIYSDFLKYLIDIDMADTMDKLSFIRYVIITGTENDLSGVISSEDLNRIRNSLTHFRYSCNDLDDTISMFDSNEDATKLGTNPCHWEYAISINDLYNIANNMVSRFEQNENVKII